MILITSWAIPLTMWLSLRWLEDLVSAIRALRSLLRLLALGPRRLALIKETRTALRREVVDLAVARGLPADFEQLVTGPSRPVPKGLVGAARKRLRYFSVKRRRAKDWNEVRGPPDSRSCSVRDSAHRSFASATSPISRTRRAWTSRQTEAAWW
jgi:glycerol-3-phosphate O-acyltransferase/dihydroxyacetone phosphate acyltransferase